jgi:hypothetical protein
LQAVQEDLQLSLPERFVFALLTFAQTPLWIGRVLILMFRHAEWVDKWHDQIDEGKVRRCLLSSFHPSVLLADYLPDRPCDLPSYALSYPK